MTISQQTNRLEADLGNGWTQHTGWIEIQSDSNQQHHTHHECMWLEQNHKRQTYYLDLETATEHEDNTIEDPEWAHEWAHSVTEHWRKHQLMEQSANDTTYKR